MSMFVRTLFTKMNRVFSKQFTKMNNGFQLDFILGQVGAEALHKLIGIENSFNSINGLSLFE